MVFGQLVRPNSDTMRQKLNVEIILRRMGCGFGKWEGSIIITALPLAGPTCPDQR